MSKRYIKRLFDDILEFSLKSKGAIVIVGPKWCGKSTTASRYSKTTIEDETIYYVYFKQADASYTLEKYIEAATPTTVVNPN